MFITLRHNKVDRSCACSKEMLVHMVLSKFSHTLKLSSCMGIVLLRSAELPLIRAMDRFWKRREIS